VGHERGGSVGGWQCDNVSRLHLDQRRGNVRTVTFRATRRAVSATLVVLAAVRTLLALVRERIPRIGCDVRKPRELNQ
jgi:hypothetical protein